VLVVEDSRFACEAMRLLCLRSGARIRRADSLRAAERHLQVYRPSVVVVDLGLPDGSGADLSTLLDRASPRISVILGTSGDDGSERAAMAAGADGFLAKPITSLSVFQQSVLAHLPVDRQPAGPRALSDETVTPDRIAYRDDMAHIADVLSEGAEDDTIDYVAQFVTAVARSARDTQLSDAGAALLAACKSGRPSRAEVARIAGLVHDRLSERIAI
jgi:CheY-like chemotaxis protein